ncbi:DUF55-domain-containing protein [Amylocystis lapponica]|nr:DUF55-domain-containing protein [Amylocystis lapponica]
MAPKYWLMKAEPDSRIVKGKEVKFSVEDFEAVKTTPWEGVRNAEARNLMKEMKVGDKVLFYHSNCKIPGIAGFAEVSKEAYPDYTAWDSTHPYYDPKTDEKNPKWYMVDVTFVARTTHFVPLALLRFIAAAPTSAPPTEVAYIGEAGAQAIQQMALVTRGRLSVQRVEEQTWGAIELLAQTGGWGDVTKPKGKRKANGTVRADGKRGRSSTSKKKDAEPESDEADEDKEAMIPTSAINRKRKAKDVEEQAEGMPVRRSTRARK